ncbi:hypothetical protein B296_00045180 [Ensete ventricosum]|uniref:Uncharacterized protein n=1 Tax=Ensete ventricosum TaxID=4639 RepID=A0A426X7B1_ENSVE|nr:hypothetical protein B296_00045180 [Ensete ventricosum]
MAYEGSKEEGRPATASPHVGSATHGQPAREASVACRGSRLQGRLASLPRAVARRGQLQGARKGLPPAGVAVPAVGVAAP